MTSEEEETMGYDEVIEATGNFGRYQLRICVLLFLPAIISAFHSMAGVFLGASTDFRCLLPSEDPANASYQLPSSLMDLAYPKDPATQTWSQCLRYDLNSTDLEGLESGGNYSSTNLTVACDSYVYDKTTYQLTTVTEFDLVCDDAWLKATADSMFMVGVMLGALTFGGLSDKYGRKPILYLACVFNMIAGFLVAISPERISFLLFRLILGTSCNAIYLVGYVSGVEMVAPKNRMAMGVVIQVFFSAGYILVTAFAYFIKNWRLLEVALTIPSVGFLLYWWFIPESVRWLLSKGRLQEAKTLILAASSENGVEISEDTLDVMLADKSDDVKIVTDDPSLLDLFRYPNLRRKTLLLFFNWFVNNGTYYGLSWNTSSLGGSDYLNFAIAAFVEIPGTAVVYFTLDRWGRRIVLCGCMIIAGISLLLIIFVPTDMQWLVVLLAMIGKSAITASFLAVYIFSAEQYPTVIRNVGVGACSTVARIGGIIAPYVLYSSSVWTPLPYVLFGSGSLIAGLSTLLLPETLNEKLPESIRDGEEFGKKNVSNVKKKVNYDMIEKS